MGEVGEEPNGTKPSVDEPDQRAGNTINKAQRLLLRATGDGIYSWALIVAVLVPIFLTTLATQDRTTNLSIPEVAVIAIVGAITMGGFIALSWLTLLRWLAGAERVVAALSVYAASGLIHALVVTWLVPRLGGSPISSLELAYRLVAYLLLMTFLLSLGTYVVTTSRIHKRRFQLLLERRAVVDSLLDEIHTKIREDQQSAIASIAHELSTELDEIAQESPDRAIVSTEYLVGEFVRPLSHEIARKVPHVRMPELDPRDFEISWRTLWRQLPAEQHLRPIATAFVISIYVLLLQLTLFAATGLGKYLLVFPVLAIGLWIVRLILRPLVVVKSRAWRALLSTVVIAAFVLPAAFVLSPFATYGTIRWDLHAIFVIEAVTITWLLTLAFALADTLEDRERELDKLDDTITFVQARGNGELWQANGQLARALHGPVQSELHAALFTIRRANAEPDEPGHESSQQVTTETIARLGASLPQLLVGGHSRHSLQQEVADTATVWQGICDIQLVADPATVSQLATDAVANDLVISIVQDAISNSIRHGGATAVEVVLVQSAASLVTVQVIDNGTKGIGSGSAGLGTHMLQDCAVTWSLRPTGGRSVGSVSDGRSEASGVPGSGPRSDGTILEATLPIHDTPDDVVGVE